MKLIEGKNWAVAYRRNKYSFYINKYFSLYMNNYVFEGDIDYQQVDFILRKFWENGCIAGFKLKGSEGSTEHPQGLAVFTPFAPNGWNIYDWPISVSLINTRGVRFIPTGIQQVDKDVVIGYIQRNKKGVGFFVDSIVQDIVVLDMVIRINLNAHKMPYLVVVDPLSEKKMKALYDKIKDDDPELFISSDEANNFKALVSGAPFILDKLYNLKQAKENELREFLGLDNMGLNEKKEHLITSELESNDNITEASEGCLIDSMNEFFERFEKLTGIHIRAHINKVETNEDEVDVDEESKEEEDIQDEE